MYTVCNIRTFTSRIKIGPLTFCCSRAISESRRKIGRKLSMELGWTMSRFSTSSGGRVRDVFAGKARARFTIRGDRKSIAESSRAIGRDRCRQIMRTGGGCDFTREIGTPHAESCAECGFSFCETRRGPRPRKGARGSRRARDPSSQRHCKYAQEMSICNEW